MYVASTTTENILQECDSRFVDGCTVCDKNWVVRFRSDTLRKFSQTVVHEVITKFASIFYSASYN